MKYWFRRSREGSVKARPALRSLCRRHPSNWRGQLAREADEIALARRHGRDDPQRPHGSPELNSLLAALDQLAPFLCFALDQLGKIRRRADKRSAIQVGQLCLDAKTSQGSVDFLIQRVDNLRWRVPGSTYSLPSRCLVARENFS